MQCVAMSRTILCGRFIATVAVKKGYGRGETALVERLTSYYHFVLRKTILPYARTICTNERSFFLFQVLHKEKISHQTPILTVLALACWGPGLYFFLTTVTTWEVIAVLGSGSELRRLYFFRLFRGGTIENRIPDTRNDAGNLPTR